MYDLISRQGLLNKICDGCGYIGYCHPNGKKCVEYERVESMPSVEPEIIRCKDCKHLLHVLKRPNEHRPGETSPEHWNCTLHEKAYSPSTTPDGFCDEAERGAGRWKY